LVGKNGFGVNNSMEATMKLMEIPETIAGCATRSAVAVEFKNISCCFKAANGKKNDAKTYTAVADTSMSVRDGEFVSVVGPTGCGKSTLLNVAAGLMQPSSGSVEIFGQPLTGLNSQAGYMFQSEALMPWRTALENITAGLEFRGVARKDSIEQAHFWMQRVGLSGFEQRYPHQLSGGMRKRVSLAQMLILDPKIILMDEPFSALDAQTRVLMENELLDLWAADRKSVIFITHDLDEAISCRTASWCFRQGRVPTRSMNLSSTCHAPGMLPKFVIPRVSPNCIRKSGTL
jgi:NitT/TauT family transport system ATP-binding protein